MHADFELAYQDRRWRWARCKRNSPPDLDDLPQWLEDLIAAPLDQQGHGEVASLKPLGHLLVAEGSWRKVQAS